MHLIKASVPERAGDPHWLLWLEVWAMAPHDRGLLQNQDLQEGRFRELIAVAIGDGQAAGEFSGDVDAEEAAVRLSALIDGLAIQVATGADGMDRRKMTRLVTADAASLLGLP
jgi:hypothetical protein